MASYSQNNIDTRLAMYTIAAGALVAGGAYAAPTTSPGFPVTAEDETVNIFIDGDSEYDFTLYASSNANCTFNGGRAYLEDNDNYAGGIQYSANQQYAGMILDGSSVSALSDFDGYSYLAACSNDTGEFPVPSRGFVGVKFIIGQATHYGYLDVGTSVGSLIATVYGACYESDFDTPIEVDACGLADEEAGPVSVPVGGLIPTTLALLGLGAVASRRRRKTQQ